MSKESNEKETVRALRECYERGDLDSLIAKANDALERLPETGRVHEFLGLAYSKLGSDVVALEHLQLAMRLRSPEVGPWRAAHRPIGRLGWSKQVQSEFWAGCNSKYETSFDMARRMVIEGDGARAIESLEEIRGSLFDSEAWKSINRSVIALADSSGASAAARAGGAESIDLPHLVFISGTGWSGSSAIFDYLREFHNVVPVAGESPVFAQGPGSLLKVYLAAHDKVSFRVRLINFFFTYLFGFRGIEDKWDLLFMQHARKQAFGGASTAYFNIIERLAVYASEAMRSESKAEREEKVKLMAAMIMSEMLLKGEHESSKTVVLDNVINVRYIEAIKLFDSSDSICCFRDPRSNYVALKYESSHYVPPVEEWTSAQRGKIAQLDENVERLSDQLVQGMVVRVRFEEFVLSERFRDALAVSVGLTLEHRDKHRYFKPWESLRNVSLHQEYSDQEEIKFIERELGDLCCEPCVRPLIEREVNDGD